MRSPASKRRFASVAKSSINARRASAKPLTLQARLMLRQAVKEFDRHRPSRGEVFGLHHQAVRFRDRRAGFALAAPVQRSG